MPHRRSFPQRITDSFRVISELDLSHAYERQAGSLALIVLVGAVVVSAVLWVQVLHPVVRTEVLVEFPDVRGLVVGDRVQVAGVTVGRVHRVELLGPGRVLVGLRVDPSARPRRDAHAEIVALNLVGGNAVSFSPGVADDFLGDVVLVGSAPASSAAMPALRAEAERVALAASVFARADLQRDVAAAQAATRRAMAALAQAPADSAAAATTAALASTDALFARLDSLVGSLAGVDSTRLAHLGASAQDLAGGLAAIQERVAVLRERVDRGDGTLARSLHDDALRRELEATRRSLRLLQEKYLGRRPTRPDTQ